MPCWEASTYWTAGRCSTERNGVGADADAGAATICCCAAAAAAATSRAAALSLLRAEVGPLLVAAPHPAASYHRVAASPWHPEERRRRQGRAQEWLKGGVGVSSGAGRPPSPTDGAVAHLCPHSRCVLVLDGWDAGAMGRTAARARKRRVQAAWAAHLCVRRGVLGRAREVLWWAGRSGGLMFLCSRPPAQTKRSCCGA